MQAVHRIDANFSLARWKQRIFSLYLIPVMLVSGCATGVSQGDLSPMTNTASRLIIYRPSSFVGIAISPKVTINGVDACRIANGKAFIKDVTPGTVNITSGLFGTPCTSSLSFSAVAGETYYIRFTMDSGETWAGVFGGVVGQAVEQAASKHSGPFDIELSDHATMGDMTPGTCDS